MQNNISLLKKQYEVRKAAIIYTRDVPEGGLDALLQAMVCKEQIGWRDHARRLIVLATDALSHAAGHGKVSHRVYFHLYIFRQDLCQFYFAIELRKINALFFFSIPNYSC